MYWMLLPYRRYFDFSGRSRRKEYWMFVLFQFIVMTVLVGLLLSGMPFGEMEMAAETGVEPSMPGPLFW
ncbi:MAG: DUF805 domain-containing protein, partial [Novosphingobium sp.]|nr:DUF805 domain-containing protein [Novosphingobium sp.]